MWKVSNLVYYAMVIGLVSSTGKGHQAVHLVSSGIVPMLGKDRNLTRFVELLLLFSGRGKIDEEMGSDYVVNGRCSGKRVRFGIDIHIDSCHREIQISNIIIEIDEENEGSSILLY